MQLRVLDLFAGLGGWSAPAREQGHDVFAVDNDPRFAVELVADVLELQPADLPWRPDLVLASPPCTAFSTLTFGHHWSPGRVPKTEAARTSLELVAATRRLIEQLDPNAWIVENPRAMLRALPRWPASSGAPSRTASWATRGACRSQPTCGGGSQPRSCCHRRAGRGPRATWPHHADRPPARKGPAPPPSVP